MEVSGWSQVAAFTELCGVMGRTTVGTCPMKLAVRRLPSPAGWRLRSTGESRTLPKGESQALCCTKCGSLSELRGLVFKRDLLRPWLCTSAALFFRINVLTSDLEGVVLDNRYYGGSCLPQYIQDVPFRKPFNLQQYTFQVKHIHFNQTGLQTSYRYVKLS